VSEKDKEYERENLVGKIQFSPLSEKERLREIDIRVGARLMEKEILRAEYSRGLQDGIYVLAIIGAIIYVAYEMYKKRVE
jgi:hypothetical protein